MEPLRVVASKIQDGLAIKRLKIERREQLDVAKLSAPAAHAPD